MKAQTKTKAKTKTTRRNTSAAALTDAKWYQEFVRHVELREFSPRTREAYLAWPRRLQGAHKRRDITKLRESEVIDFLISLRNEQGLKDATVNQAVCAMRAFYRDHLGRDWKAWSKIKIRRDEQLPNVLSREEVERFLFHGTPLAMRFRNRLEIALKTDHPELHARLTQQHPEVLNRSLPSLVSKQSRMSLPHDASRMGFAAAPQSPWPPPTALSTPRDASRTRNQLRIRRK